ncbi:DNA-directed RNA polymerase subunit beta [Sporosarcina saromensis]|uniref:DNA-directed RNA polymerase subunit beta n=1 Tax=Sporosarcina saromensis TaxID=359365 RepID=A0ABU4GCG3_9BACL|nr:DNA-directed RNA polymerase subunit beta [Sporosarcina saromensis]MDW0114062.1 DNA-directed RNA polymerase subunit beta [Sporosarcina saromensis]
MTDDKQKSPQLNRRDATEKEIVSSRSARSKQKKQKPVKEEQETKKIRWVQIRLLPIWLRIILVILILGVAAITGAMFGYGILGDGQPADVLKKETWMHIFDIMSGKES